MSVTFTPSSVSLTAFGFETKTQQFTVRNDGATAVTVSVSGTDLSATATEVAPGSSATITVTYYPTTTTASRGALTAAAAGAIAATADIFCTPENPLYIDASSSLGTVVVGASSSGTVLVRNRANVAAALSLPSAPYSIPSPYDSVPAGAMSAVPITFTPAAVGTHTTTLTLSVGSWSVTCSVSGEAVTAITSATAATTGVTTETTSSTEARQAMYIGVPNPDTTFNLGAKRTTKVMVDGFGLDTSADGYLNAGGKIGIQAVGTVHVQSLDSNINLTAGRDADGKNGDVVIGAQNNSFLLGNAGVLIATVGDDPTSRDATTNMPNDGGITRAKEAASIVSGVFSAFDAFVGLSMTAYSIKGSISTAGSFKKPGTWIPLIGAAAGFATAIAGAVSSFGSVTGVSVAGPGTPGVTIYGHAGLLMGTPGFASLYSGAGLVLASPFPALIGVDVSVLGVKDVSVTGLREASVSGGVSASIHGETGVKVDTGAAGTVHLEAGPTGLSSQLDVAPTGITAHATSELAATVGPTKHTKLSMKPNAVKVESAMPGASITLDAGPTGTLTLKASGFELTIGSSGITLKKTGGVASINVGHLMVKLKAGATVSQTMSATGTVFAGSFKSPTILANP